MSAWHREHPELVGTDADPWMVHDDYRRALHHHRPLNTSGASSGSSVPEQPAGEGHFLPRVAPAGDSLKRFQRTGMSCDNCGASEDQSCQPWCRGEQIS